MVILFINFCSMNVICPEKPVTIVLPGITLDLKPGHNLTVSTSSSGYINLRLAPQALPTCKDSSVSPLQNRSQLSRPCFPNAISNPVEMSRPLSPIAPKLMEDSMDLGNLETDLPKEEDRILSPWQRISSKAHPFDPYQLTTPTCLSNTTEDFQLCPISTLNLDPGL